MYVCLVTKLYLTPGGCGFIRYGGIYGEPLHFLDHWEDLSTHVSLYYFHYFLLLMICHSTSPFHYTYINIVSLLVSIFIGALYWVIVHM